jgi:phytoene/squalene synthetase
MVSLSLMRDTRFYQEHLDRVSRSFAFCIERLEPPFRQWVSLSYLLCRVLDTVEDALWPEGGEQARQFTLFLEFLEAGPAATAVANWSGRFPPGISAGEQGLVSDFSALLEDLHSLPDGVRRAISGPVRRMALGMRRFAEESKGSLRLADLSEVNRYCFVVAGLVGGLLSRLYLAFRPSFIPPGGFHLDGCHFGLFLQKVNLLKDQRVDEREGRFLLPDRAAALVSLRENARGALSYLLSLPSNERGYRLFCGWSLFIGLASIPWIEESFARNDPGIRIPRSRTLELMCRAEEVIEDNHATAALYEELERALPTSETSPAASVGRPASDVMPEWFQDLLRDDQLGREALTELGFSR